MANKNGRPAKSEASVYDQEYVQRLLAELYKYGGSAQRLELFKALRAGGSVAPAYELKRVIQFGWAELGDGDIVSVTAKARELHEDSLEEPSGVELF